MLYYFIILYFREIEVEGKDMRERRQRQIPSSCGRVTTRSEFEEANNSLTARFGKKSVTWKEIEKIESGS